MYSITYAPLNMVHKFRTPIGFYACAVPLLIVGEFGLWRSVMRRGSTR
jgi:hypothetical protein